MFGWIIITAIICYTAYRIVELRFEYCLCSQEEDDPKELG
jgi:hypothetical protein